MAFADYAEHDGLGLAALVKSKKASPAEILEAAIERIEKHNGVLNAVVHKEYDEARKTAAGDLPEGPFKGVPFLIKDLGAQVKGWPRTRHSSMGVPRTVLADRFLLRINSSASSRKLPVKFSVMVA